MTDNITVYQVLSVSDGYAIQDWFLSKEAAERCEKWSESSELSVFSVSQDFLRQAGCSDDDWSEEECKAK